VLADIATAVTGADHRDLVAKRVTERIGLPRVLGLDAAAADGIADVALVGVAATAEELAAAGISEIPENEVTPDALMTANRPEYRAVGLPGGGAFMRAMDLALYYQALLHDPERLWSAELLADVTGNVRNRLPDRLMGVPANRSLGLIVKGDDEFAAFRGFGHTASARSFGHNGAGGQLAFADPETGLSVGYCTNGLELNMFKEWSRAAGIASRAAVCATPI
jgi:CubicO group peptidase (beta-lactamase class C family)